MLQSAGGWHPSAGVDVVDQQLAYGELLPVRVPHLDDLAALR
jgi:hypothetical protein